VKVLLDTNIILDDALEREPFLEASEQVLVLIGRQSLLLGIPMQSIGTREREILSSFNCIRYQ